jgi:hypothetical protein
MGAKTTQCGVSPLLPTDRSAEALGALMEPCTLAQGHSGDHRNSLAVWAASPAAQHTDPEGSDAPSACPVCQDFAERLAKAFSAREMSEHTDLKVEHARHLKAVHPDWAKRDGTLYGPDRETNAYDLEAPGNAFSWRGRMWP